MKTTTVINKKEMINAKSATDLAIGIQKSISQIDEFVKQNDYHLNAQLPGEIMNYDLIATISNLSLKKRKELRNCLWRISNYPSLTSINRYLHFLMTKVLKSDTRYKILKSEKQLKIEEKRKKYREALEILKKTHANYKEEKGDFYKSRLAKSQKI
jgi:hypothetical protein